MRVVVVTPHLPPVPGGIATFSGELIQGLKRKGIEASGIALQGQDSPDWEIVRGGKIRFACSAFSKILRSNPDVVHAHSHWYTLLPAAAIRFIRPSTRVVFTFHTQRDARGVVDSIIRMLLAYCTSVSYVSKELQVRYPTWTRTPQYVIYPAPESKVVTKGSVNGPIRRWSLPGRTVVVFIGPLVWPGKVEGVRLLAKAFSLALNHHPEALLVIAGDGPLRPQLEESARVLLGENVVFLGNIDDVRAVLGDCDIYAHISLQEGMPISLLNAMAMERAVIATKVGGIPEAIIDEENGLLVPPDVDAIARGLERLIEEPELRARLGTAAARFVRDHFTWDNTVARFLECYGVTC